MARKDMSYSRICLSDAFATLVACSVTFTVCRDLEISSGPYRLGRVLLDLEEYVHI